MRRLMVVTGVACSLAATVACGDMTTAEPPAIRIVHAALASPSTNTSPNIPHLLSWTTSGEDFDAEALILVADFEPIGAETAEAAAARYAPGFTASGNGIHVYAVPASRELKPAELPVDVLKKSQDVIAALQTRLKDSKSS